MPLVFALFKVAFTNFRGYLSLKCLIQTLSLSSKFLPRFFFFKIVEFLHLVLSKASRSFWTLSPPPNWWGVVGGKRGKRREGRGRVSDRPLANELKRGRRWEGKKEEGEMEEKAQQPKHRKRRRKI